MSIAARVSVEIARPVSEVWSFFENTANLPLWVPGFVDFEITSPPPHGAGATYTMKIKEGRHVNEYQGKNLEWEPRRRVREYMCGGRFKDGERVTAAYDFIDLGDRCRLDYQSEFHTKRMLALLLKLPFWLYCRSMIRALKRAAESA
ncbi:MAG: SRPBCC family protein [Planctomycetota bacterium]|nr:SRPBCC family protein [Planctomycetota bacterium]